MRIPGAVLLVNWRVIRISSSFLLFCGDFWSVYLLVCHLNFMLLLVGRGFSWQGPGAAFIWRYS